MEKLTLAISKTQLWNTELNHKFVVNNFLLKTAEILGEIQKKKFLIFNAIQVRRLNPILINIVYLRVLLKQITATDHMQPLSNNRIEKYYDITLVLI